MLRGEVAHDWSRNCTSNQFLTLVHAPLRHSFCFPWARKCLTIISNAALYYGKCMLNSVFPRCKLTTKSPGRNTAYLFYFIIYYIFINTCSLTYVSRHPAQRVSCHRRGQFGQCPGTDCCWGRAGRRGRTGEWTHSRCYMNSCLR